MASSVIGEFPSVACTLPRSASDVQLSATLRDAVTKGLPPLTIVRAPRGYGKTALISSWLDADLPMEAIHYLSLSKQCREEKSFWAELTAVVFDDPELGPEGIMAALAADEKKRLIIIDNFHLAGAAGNVRELDEHLIEIVRRFSHVFLIVVGRVLRPIETLGAMALPTTIVGPRELALDSQRLQALATGLGVRMSRNRAVALTDGVAGWPALLRVSLNHAALTEEEPDLSLPAMMNYLDAVLRDADDPALRRFVMRACVAEELTAEITRALTDDGLGAHHLRAAYSLGLLRRIPDTADYEFPRAIKRGLFEMMREEYPEAAQEAHEVLAKLHGGARDPIQMLQHAVSAGDWDAALEVLHTEFLALVTYQSDRTYEMVRQLPSRVRESSAYARAVFVEGRGIPQAREGYGTWSGEEDAGRVSDLLARLGMSETAEIDDATVLLMWGLNAASSGQMDTAVYVLNQSWLRAQQAPDLAPLAHLAASVIAAMHAYQGEIYLAQAWLEDGEKLRADEEAPPPRFAETSYGFAAAMSRVDAGEEAAGEMLARIPEPKYRDVMWALITFARARHGSLYGSEEEVLALINDLRSALRYLTRGSVSETVLINALVELLIRADMLPIARELANRLAPTDSATISHARLALAQNDFREAMRLAAQVEDSLTQFPRLVVERDVILASAAHGLGDFASAQKHFERAIQAVKGGDQARALAILPHYLFAALAADDETAREMWPVKSAAGESTARIGELTPREVQILRSLSHLPGPSAVAEALDLSINTVKTHVQAIYRKLQVTNRAEAIEHLR